MLIFLAIGVQLAVIAYTHFSGYYILQGYGHFFTRFAVGTSLSLLASFFLAYPDLLLIQYFNKFLPWGKRVFKRLFFQLFTSVFIAAIVAIGITLLSHQIKSFEEDLGEVLYYNSLIASVVNLILMTILEGAIYFEESKKAQQEASNLQEELSQIKFEVLKSQINPHFMFNSLNVLSGLIKKNPDKAQEFVDEFAHIYRYVLDTIEQPVTTLELELDFMRSYLFLQQIRYGQDLKFTENIGGELLSALLPPLSLQVLLENAIKHNVVNKENPLKIDIFTRGDWLVVRNNIQPKTTSKSTGLGLKNLRKRYAFIGDTEPHFKVVNGHYVVMLPLVMNEDQGL
ncbi:sensor histidine kinase [Marinilabilia rubra]|uniref:sensor histidine kinase n=1 Tax=Marinilabilia rubra TaxID=2162893 RepID=UPI001304F9B5|nr:histidine kinase [Marinilabilia rubra]